MKAWQSLRAQFAGALIAASLMSVGLFAYDAVRSGSTEHSYLCWNLLLAWLPLLFAAALMRLLRTKLWSSWPALTLSVLWIIFLPNSFYMVSDFIHLQDIPAADILYDAVMYSAFISTGVILGYTSLHLVHRQLLKRLTVMEANSWVGVTLLISSIAIFVGRDLRWNSWDILTSPTGLLFDVSDRLQHPSAYPEMLLTIATFFTLLAVMYIVMDRAIAVIRES